MYDIEESQINAFIQEELTPEFYDKNELLGEIYITAKAKEKGE